MDVNNLVSKIRGVVRRLHEKKIDEELIERIKEQYKNGHSTVEPLKFTEPLASLKPVRFPFDNYFSDITMLDKTTKLKLNPRAVSLIDKTINDITISKEAIAEFQLGIEAANETIKADSNHEFGYENYKTVVDSLKSDLENKIASQHQKELKAMEQLLNGREFKLHLTSFNDREQEHIKNSIIEKLKSTQKEQLEKFNKNAQQELDSLNQKKLADEARLEFLACIANCNSDNAEALEKLYKRHQAQQNPSLNNSIGFDITDKGCKLVGIKASEITTFETISGKTVQCIDGEYSIQSKMFGFAISKADSYQIALAIRATLCERGIAPDKQTITTRVSHPNKEDAMRLAKNAFEAALEAGFDKDNITLYVNNEVKKASDLGVDTATPKLDKNISDAKGNAELKQKIQVVKQNKQAAIDNSAAAQAPAAKP